MVIGTTLFVIYNAAFAREKAGNPNWIKSYWFVPIAPQGKPPENFSEEEASLMPEDCGICHNEQLSQWQTSRHAESMREGILGQMGDPWLSPESIINCQSCHAPLYEQQPFIYAGGQVLGNLLYSKKLQLKGVTCAACHVRKHVRYGPPPRKKEALEEAGSPPHNGFKQINDFNRSEFCKGCHQFTPDQRKLNGKLFEDTYEQWKSSPYAKKEIQCAGCHMPDRKHTFRGIHSERMVKNGMTIKYSRKADSASLFITNSNTGHKMPTYVTPKIAVIGRVINEDGVTIEGTEEERSIQWMVNLSLTKEYFDTRLDPGETFKAAFDFPQKHKGNFFEVEVRVFPDEFYRRFFEALLDNPPEGIKTDLIAKALEDARNSAFTVFKRKVAY